MSQSKRGFGRDVFRVFGALAVAVLVWFLVVSSARAQSCPGGVCGQPATYFVQPAMAPASCSCTNCPAGGQCSAGQCGRAGCVPMSANTCAGGNCGTSASKVRFPILHRITHPFGGRKR